MNEAEVMAETQSHVDRVQDLASTFAGLLCDRAAVHDNTKFLPPEREEFILRTQHLKGLDYGSAEYKEQLKLMEPALKHHYQCNHHHPEHYENGIDGMTLIDLVEMFCDWIAASERHESGDIFKSIEYNTERFGLSEQLASVLRNTAMRVFGSRKSRVEGKPERQGKEEE